MYDEGGSDGDGGDGGGGGGDGDGGDGGGERYSQRMRALFSQRPSAVWEMVEPPSV